MPTRNTQTVTEVGVNNRTATHLSTNIIVKVENRIVSAIQEMSYNEKRTIKQIDELGTDGHIDSCPTKSTDITGSCKRIRWDKQRIAEAFARGFIHISAQRKPFDIEIHDFFHDSNPDNYIITVLKNVWINSIDQSYSTSDWTINENMGFEAEHIYSFISGTGKNVVTGVSNGQEPLNSLNLYEQQADVGLYRGALDAAGVLNSYLE